jgi:L-amino acid N-acyltransferase YncA
MLCVGGKMERVAFVEEEFMQPADRPADRDADPVIRPVMADDLGAVAAIFAHYVISSLVTFEITPPTVEYWHQTCADLSRRGLPFLVCEQAGQVVGYAYAAPWRAKPAYRHTVESTIYLSPDYTGQGLGRRLLTALLRQCALAGAEQVIAVIAESGGVPASEALHRACGYIEAGRLRKVGRKHGRVIDTLLMQYDLTARDDLAARLAAGPAMSEATLPGSGQPTAR